MIKRVNVMRVCKSKKKREKNRGSGERNRMSNDRRVGEGELLVPDVGKEVQWTKHD